MPCYAAWHGVSTKSTPAPDLGEHQPLDCLLYRVEHGPEGQGQPLQDTETGVSENTIRIAVVADVDNSIRPGLFQDVVNGVNAFAKFVNSRGAWPAARRATTSAVAGRCLLPPREYQQINVPLTTEHALIATIGTCTAKSGHSHESQHATVGTRKAGS